APRNGKAHDRAPRHGESPARPALAQGRSRPLLRRRSEAAARPSARGRARAAREPVDVRADDGLPGDLGAAAGMGLGLPALRLARRAAGGRAAPQFPAASLRARPRPPWRRSRLARGARTPPGVSWRAAQGGRALRFRARFVIAKASLLGFSPAV